MAWPHDAPCFAKVRNVDKIICQVKDLAWICHDIFGQFDPTRVVPLTGSFCYFFPHSFCAEIKYIRIIQEIPATIS